MLFGVGGGHGVTAGGFERVQSPRDRELGCSKAKLPSPEKTKNYLPKSKKKVDNQCLEMDGVVCKQSPLDRASLLKGKSQIS